MLARSSVLGSVLAFGLAIVPAAATAVVSCATSAAAAAQCQPHGAGCLAPASASISCGTLPQIGTTWLVCARPTCSTNSQFLMIGRCSGPTLLPTALTCFGCPRCNLDIQPAATLTWNGFGCYGIGIPRNTSLIGGVFCVQNGCLFTRPCVCLTNALQVRIIQ